LAELSRTPRLSRGGIGRPHTPHSRRLIAGAFGLGCFLFARRYSGNPSWFLLLPLLRCFSSGGSRSSRSDGRSRQEFLFGDPRIEGCLRLPGAYRSLPRPSSAPKPSHPPDSVVISKFPGSHGWSRKSMHGLIEERPLLQGSSSSPSSLDLAGSGIALSLWVEHVLPNLFLGGDPAAGSPTATLLRLNPPYKAQVRHGQLSTMPHPNLIRVVRRAVCAKSRDVFTAG
jgi:hypothetical protein